MAVQGIGARLVTERPSRQLRHGSGRDGFGAKDDEQPRHRVTFAKPFAVGVYEVPRGQLETFIDSTGHDAGNSRLMRVTYRLRSPVEGRYFGLGFRVARDID